MLSKRKVIILLVLLAIAGGAYYTFGGSGHSSGDSDQHAHEEHKDDHAEGGEHGHGDKDEHAHEAEKAGDEHGHDHGAAAGEHGEEGEGEHGEEGKISDNAAKMLNVEVLEAGGALVQSTINVTGRVTLNQNTSAQVKARFPGMIRSVLKEPGQTVKAGETLATVESNDSLQVYPVKSPTAGLVITRNASVGEFAGDTPLFLVANTSNLWAELFVFSKDGERLQPGQKVHIQCLDDGMTSESTISVVLPTTEASSQTMVARATIDNPQNHWRSGMNIRADVVLAEKQVPLAVKTDAIQRLEGNDVVFVELPNEPNTYKAQPVEIGVSDETWTEIRSGISAGQRYVAKNSFVVKAEIGKAGAEHSH